MTQASVGIDVSGRIIVLEELQTALVAGGVSLPRGLTITGPPRTSVPFPPPLPGALLPLPDGSKLFTHDEQGQPVDLPPEAVPIVAAYTPTLP